MHQLTSADPGRWLPPTSPKDQSLHTFYQGLDIYYRRGDRVEILKKSTVDMSQKKIHFRFCLCPSLQIISGRPLNRVYVFDKITFLGGNYRQTGDHPDSGAVCPASSLKPHSSRINGVIKQNKSKFSGKLIQNCSDFVLIQHNFLISVEQHNFSQKLRCLSQKSMRVSKHN